MAEKAPCEDNGRKDQEWGLDTKIDRPSVTKFKQCYWLFHRATVV